MNDTEHHPSGHARKFNSADYFKITIFGFALAALWSSLHSIILPLRLLDFVAESEKNTYLGIISGTGLVLAIIVQPIAGAISDRSGFGWGRRRPYILIGAVLAVLLLPGIGLAGGYIALFAVYCLLQIASNTAHGPYQGFIPDLVPVGNRGRASGIKSFVEIAGGVVLLRLVGPLMDRYHADAGVSWLWLSLGSVAVVLLGATIATMLLVRETPLTSGYRSPWLPDRYRTARFYVRADFVGLILSRIILFIRQHPAFIFFLLSRLFILMAFAILQRFAIYFLSDVVGITRPAAVTADLLIVVGVCMLVTVYPAGRLSDRLGRRVIGVSSGIIGALGIIFLFFSPDYSTVLVSGGLLGIASGAFTSSNWALATDLVVPGKEARYLGLTNLATAGAAALVLFTIGPAIDIINRYAPNLGYSAMLLVCFVFFVAGALLLTRINNSTDKAKQNLPTPGTGQGDK